MTKLFNKFKKLFLNPFLGQILFKKNKSVWVRQNFRWVSNTMPKILKNPNNPIPRKCLDRRTLGKDRQALLHRTLPANTVSRITFLSIKYSMYKHQFGHTICYTLYTIYVCILDISFSSISRKFDWSFTFHSFTKNFARTTKFISIFFSPKL